MVQSDVRGKGERPRVRQAGELGWDDSVYEKNGDGVQDGHDGPSAGPGDGDRGGHGAGGGERPGRRRRVLRWSATVLAVVILGTAGAGYLYYQHLNDNLKKDDLNIGDAKDRAAESKPNAAGQIPLNILLIGSDARDSAENQKLGGAKDTFGGPPNADVQMLVHVSADRTNMSVVSMPRDTLLPVPKCTDPKTQQVYTASTLAMANDSLRRGGPGCTVATWEKLTDIHIDHFMMVDFSGVVSMADAIGGVPVCVDKNIYSHTSSGHGSGLKLKAGTTSVKGEQALQWLRTRYGFEDGSDIARTKAQHQYMSSMVRQLRANATLSNPDKLRKLAETATSALTVDNGLGTVAKLYDLSTELKKVPTARITMTTMPFVYSGERVLPKPGDAEKLFRLVREDIALDGKDTQKKPAPAPATAPTDSDDKIAVQVQNGTRTSTQAPVRGRASAMAQVLVDKGFTEARADSSTVLSEDTTVIRYPSADLKGDAERVAKALGIPGGSVQKSTDVSGVTLVVGADWRSDSAYQAPKEDNKTPTTANVLNGADKQCMQVDPNYSW
ncbi:transcriptional regulator [Streptomyces hygroscopicus]|uniref:LCP family protein n=1 Tax=Streptomyces hygroscopicus TaxID=1912 RepID=UPI00223FB169|nr:LCP family protein [Streptomyces hygroscopicus]MCW7943344.1 transcriptional regulator [Streptomyces hygroscopicus]